MRRWAKRDVRHPARQLALAAALTLVSGGFMVWAGYVFATGRITTGLWITTPPGFTIEIAFALLRRVDRTAGRSAPSLRARVSQELVILVAGGVMVSAGFAGADVSWWLAAFLFVIGGPVIAAGVWIGRRHVATTATDPLVSLAGAPE
jgi:hypothetical protein